MLAAAILSMSSMEDGLPLGDIVPKTNYASPFLTLQAKDYGEYPAYVIIGMNWDGTPVSFTLKRMRMRAERAYVGDLAG
mgnify:CR=1 FL=1